jgi:hypothetical protein
MYSQSGTVEWGGEVEPFVNKEGILVSFLADGNPYSCVLVDDENNTFIASFGTRPGYNTIRLTWNMFQQELSMERPDPVPIRPEMIRFIKFRCACACMLFDSTVAGAGAHTACDDQLHRFQLHMYATFAAAAAAAACDGQSPTFEKRMEFRSNTYS